MRQQFRDDLLPRALVIGMTEEQFWNANPVIMKPYIDAYNMKNEYELQRANLISYIQGIYVKDALLCTVGNMFKGKSDKPIEYPDEPYDFFRKKEEPHELTEEEKIEQTKALFMRLDVMKSNFELTH